MREKHSQNWVPREYSPFAAQSLARTCVSGGLMRLNGCDTAILADQQGATSAVPHGSISSVTQA